MQSAREALPGRGVYTPGAAVDPVAVVRLVSGFSREWLIIVRAGVEFFDENICKSPLVGDTYTVSTVAGIVRRF